MEFFNDYDRYCDMKKIIAFILCFFIASPAFASINTSAKQAVIIDMGTGMVLLDKAANEKMPTSSMSKVMTGYMVFDALKKGQVRMDTMMDVSEKAWKMGGSKMFIEVGKKVSVEDLLKGVIVQSGNDASVALAEGLSGDEDQFARAMTLKAKELGMNDTNLVNSSGWPDPNHYSTAHDLAILAQRLIVDYPHEYSLYSIKEFTFNGIKQPNRNPLLYRNLGVDGIKTGHTEAGGYGLMASGEVDGRRVVMVLNGMESAQERANESARLISWALNSFENKDLIKMDQILDEAPAVMGGRKKVSLTVNRDVRVTIPKGAEKSVKIEVEYQSPVKAPVQKGDVLGNVHIAIPQIGEFMVPLVAAEDLPKSGFFSGAMEKLFLMLLGG